MSTDSKSRRSERTDDVNDPMVGRRLASYEVLGRVAAGGMGVVYRARHVYIDKIVALKVLDQELSSRPELIERFRTEAQSLARVEHENVVKVIDILEDKGLHFIVMDFAEGTNLRVLVKRKGPMKGDELLSVARQTAEALYAAHRKGILHRDIKPENLIMNSRGRCKLADFGLAGDLRLITEGHEGPLSFGTPAYSAPEVMRRMVPDRRSDIFSYGATLYFLATGEPPFGQTGSQQILQRQKHGSEPLENRRADLSPKFCRIVNDCLKWHPKERPDSFREILDRLPRRGFATEVKLTDTHITEPTGLLTTEAVTEESPAISRTVAVASVVLGAAAIVLIAALWWSNRDRTTDAPDEQPIAVAPVPDENDTDPDDTTDPTVPDSTENGTDEDDDPQPTGPEVTERDAFNAAELASRTALARADYHEAYQAWSRFIAEYPGSELASDAARRRAAVRQRVADLRETEFDKARETSREAHEAGRTAEALAALDRFPAELLVPLDDSDEVSVRHQIESRRRAVLADEARELATLIDRADRLRREWTAANERTEEWMELRRMRVAGNLLQERELLEQFLPGRTTETQKEVGERLSRLRKLLEGVHQAAVLPANEWRHYNDQVLGEWAAWLDAEFDKISGTLARRDFTAALNTTRDLGVQLRANAEGYTWSSREVAERAARPEFLLRMLGLFEEDVRLAAGLPAALESELREMRASGTIREFSVEQADADRPRTIIGRVVDVGRDRFTVAHDSSRTVIRFEQLATRSVRRIVSSSDNPDSVLRLLAWLAAQGEAKDATDEFTRLERLDRTTPEQLRVATEMMDANRLAPSVRRSLQYVAARTGVMGKSAFVEQHGEDARESRLLLAQQSLEEDAIAATEYLTLAREVEDPEYIHLETLQRAMELGTPVTSDFEMRKALEPFCVDARASFAEFLMDNDDTLRAREVAGQALLLDASNERAFKIRHR
jgi:serine/threonine protein kinase